VTAETRPETVAVIIAAYNASATIARAISSALAEPEAAEIIVIDDASTDDTVQCARAADDGSGRLRIITQPRNSGPSAARNRAIRESVSPWITILDADDFFLPGRLSGLLKFSAGNDFIADNMWQVREDALDGPRRKLLNESFSTAKTISFSEFVLSNITRKKTQREELGFIKPLIKRSFLAEHNIWYQEHMRLGEDYELYARSLALGARMYLVPAQGYVSVVRSDSLSGKHSEEDLLHLRDCDDLLQNSCPLSEADKSALRQHYLSIDCRLQWRLLILAVKDRDIRAGFLTFLRPHPVPLYLTGKLWEQFLIRIFGKIRRTSL
jgi:succinoglycan biosynthesis protein ExoU